MPIGIIFVIPLIMWIIQKITNTTGKKADYLRRRAFAYCILICFFLSLFNFIPIFIEGIKIIPTDTQGFKTYKFAKFLLPNLVIYGSIFNFGFKNTKGENKGFFFSIWQAYKSEYVVIKNDSGLTKERKT